MKLPGIAACLAVALAASTHGIHGATVKDREGAVRQDKAAMEKDFRWIYSDVRRGLAEARRTGKPLLVVLRCVPCLSCAGIDSSVLQEPGLAPLLERFVCVRVINANDLDLSVFQFDYDLSFSTLFLNGDGTVYGRYGSWTHQKNPADKTTAGYQRALEAALEVHAGYPANRAALAGKQGAPTPFKTPVDIPELAQKYKPVLDWDGKVVPSCVHCHQIGEALRTSFREKKQPIPTALIFPMPLPETVGFTLVPEQVARVGAVTPGSPAARAGLQAGDDLVSVAGQPLVSVADVSWALHRAPDSGPLDIRFKRDGTGHTANLELPAGWRFKSDITRRVGTWSMRAMAAGGLSLEDLDDATRRQNGLPDDALALRVKNLGQYGRHAAAKNAGFRKDDILVEIGGFQGRMGEGELLGRLLQAHQTGEKLTAVVIRGGRRVNLKLPMQ